MPATKKPFTPSHIHLLHLYVHVQRQSITLRRAHFSVCVQVAKKPTSLSHTQAASIPYVACTTFTALRLGCVNEKNARNKKLGLLSSHTQITTHTVTLSQSLDSYD